MSLPPIYSRRKRQAELTSADIYSYDYIPENVRIQLFMNIMSSLEDLKLVGSRRVEVFNAIVIELREEIGVRKLGSHRTSSIESELQEWFIEEADVTHILDTLEYWHIIGGHAAGRHGPRWREKFERVVERVNARLREACIGYAIVEGQIVEKSNEYLHNEAVLPALHLLGQERFKGANKEFRSAHEAYRNGEYEDCLSDCLKAFESVMKVIADRRKWELPEVPNAKTLIDALFEKCFVPKYMQSQFSALRSVLESSVPVTRNKSSGHGRGTEERDIPASLAAFQLHQTASIIVFLAELDKVPPSIQ